MNNLRSCSLKRRGGGSEPGETMRLATLAAFLVAVANATTEIETDRDGVRIITEANLDDFLASNDVALVKFYSQSCARCRELRPEFARAARELGKFGLNLGKVDAVAETALVQEFNVKAGTHFGCHLKFIPSNCFLEFDFQSYPKLMLFIKGARVEDYEGEGDWADIVDYMRRNTDPEYVSPPSPVITLTNGNLTDFVKDKRVAMVSCELATELQFLIDHPRLGRSCFTLLGASTARP